MEPLAEGATTPTRQTQPLPSQACASRMPLAPAEAVDIPAPAPAVRTATLDRKRILDATDTILVDEGYDATTIRRIARELDCAVGSIYRYFTDKRDLLNAVTQRRLEPVAMRVELGSPIEKTMQAYLDAAREQPEQYRLMYWLASVGKRDDTPATPRVVQRIIDGWALQLSDENRAWQIWAELHGCIILSLPAAKTDRVIAELSLMTLPLVAEIGAASPGSPGSGGSENNLSSATDRAASRSPDWQSVEDVPYAADEQLHADAHRVFTHARTLADGQAAFDRLSPGRPPLPVDEID